MADLQSNSRSEEERIFALASLYLECDEIIQISREEYETLAKLKDIVIDAITFERCYALAVDNYAELRDALSSLSITPESKASDYSSGLACFNLVDRRIMNFCCTTKAYVDQIKQLFKGIDFNFTSLANSKFQAMYDNSIHYRIMEAFRNHVQHSRLPLSSITYPNSDTLATANSAALFARKSDVSTNANFKRRVLDELPENIDLGACAAKYMSNLSATHIELRKALDHSITGARSTLRKAIARYRDEFDLTHPVVVAAITRGTTHERHLLSNPWEPLIDEMRGTNSQILGMDVEDLSHSRISI